MENHPEIKIFKKTDLENIDNSYIKECDEIGGINEIDGINLIKELENLSDSSPINDINNEIEPDEVSIYDAEIITGRCRIISIKIQSGIFYIFGKMAQLYKYLQACHK